ncbi:MAG: hypothetical protein KGL39_45700 [Patescibacteria group bacterium]|nr:hypothetical protein [Patescibacteria group bacterium]
MNPIAKMMVEGERIASMLNPIRTRKEVGKIIGITGERCRQIEHLAIGKAAFRLRQLLEIERKQLAGEIPKTAAKEFLSQIRQEAESGTSKRSINEAGSLKLALNQTSGNEIGQNVDF